MVSIQPKPNEMLTPNKLAYLRRMRARDINEHAIEQESYKLPKGLTAKKPVPDRDWTNRPGIYQGREQMEEMDADPLHRDKFSKAERLDAWDEVERWHLWARENNAGIPPTTGIYLVSAGMGAGKTLWAACEALLLWKYMAVPVFHNMGILFGYRLSPEEMYSFADLVPPGSIVIIDEIAAVADTYGGNSTRSRTLFSTMTSFRKQGNLCFGMTAAEASVHWQLRTNVKAIIEPQTYWPTKSGIIGKSASGRNLVGRRPAEKDELIAPDFCYLTTFALDAPWEGRRIIEDYRAEVFGKDARRKKKNWKTVTMPIRGPLMYTQTAKLVDTYERVPIGEQFDVGADAMKTVRQRINRGDITREENNHQQNNLISQDSTQTVSQPEHPYDMLLAFTVKQNVWRQFQFASGMRARQIPYTEISRAFNHINPQEKTTVSRLRDYFRSGSYNTATKNRVSVDELIEKFAPDMQTLPAQVNGAGNG